MHTCFGLSTYKQPLLCCEVTGFKGQNVMIQWTDLTPLQMRFEDQDTHDMFLVDLNAWVAIDNKLDGWVEVPVPWPAILVPPGKNS